MSKNNEVLTKAYELCHRLDCNLLYLVRFGSHLYGTNTEASDSDYKGLFMPSLDSLILNKAPKHISWNTGSDGGKNSKEDIDFQLWDIRYWIKKLLEVGDTNAIDLLYSYSNTQEIIEMMPEVLPVFKNPLKMFSPKKCTSYMGYVIGQAKKYGIKGSRVRVLKDIYEFVRAKDFNRLEFDNTKLASIAQEILDKFYDESYCFVKVVNGEDALVVCGKVHLYNISISEFYSRISKAYTTYGDRAKLAEKNEGLDWKAISHAYRCLNQLEQLFTEKKITFPLASRDYLKKIKEGRVQWKDCDKELSNKLEEITIMKERCEWDYRDTRFIDDFLIGLYDKVYLEA